MRNKSGAEACVTIVVAALAKPPRPYNLSAFVSSPLPLHAPSHKMTTETLEIEFSIPG